MIYLFEDRPERKKQYFGDRVLPSGICEAKFTYQPSDGSVADYLDRLFTDAEGAIVHKSYSGLESGQFSEIRDYFKRKGKLFVVFSGGIPSANCIPVNNTWQVYINSRVLYTNLEEFARLKNVQVLCFGQKWKIAECLNCLRDLKTAFSFAEVKEKVDVNIPRRILNNLINILTQYKGRFEELDSVIDKLVAWLENSSDLTPAIVKDQMNKDFNFIIHAVR